MNRRSRNRKGITSVLAMLFLIVFSILAIGFYASTTTSVQITANQQRSNRARLAAESGVQFMRYHLARVSIPSSSTTVLNELYDDLRSSLQGTTNLGGNSISITGTSPNQVIYIPSNSSSYIPIDTTDGTGFTAMIKEWGGNIICTVTGRSGPTSSANGKSVSLQFERVTVPWKVFDYAVASKGQVLMQKGSLTGVAGVSTDDIATMMSSKSSGNAITVTGGTIGGDLNVLDDNQVSVSGGSVGGTSNTVSIMNAHVHEVPAPTFPTFDTSVFAQYATNTYSSGSTLSNVRIPRGTNPKFTGGATIQGILYVESPNTIEFRGNVKLNGFIVFEGTNDTTKNVIDMSGNFTWGTLPTGSAYDALRSTTGVAILGPTTLMTMSGSSDSTIKGNVILGRFVNAGSADMTIDQGTLMTLDDTSSTASATFNGKTVKFKAIGKNNQPSQGVTYSQKYSPVAGSFQELD
ncbi:MAG TPA: pilus assembly PilX N-terminal domain-containing protein [Tepidisphaeraceae bacterium]|jgi:hypothetical protein